MNASLSKSFYFVVVLVIIYQILLGTASQSCNSLDFVKECIVVCHFCSEFK